MLTIFNANVRSLGPKISSLIVAFEELGMNAAVVSETWMQQDSEISEIAAELSAGHALYMQLRNRTQMAANGRKYGGVAIISDTNKASFKEFPLLNRGDFEVLASTAKLKGVGRVALIAAYIPPNYVAARAHECIEHISDVVGKLKRKFKGCYITVAGDFNQWPIHSIAAEHPE